MDSSTFDRLVKETKGWVFATAYHILRSRAEAEDVMQETFLALYTHYDTLDSKEAVYRWLKTVAVNKSLNAAQRNIFVELEDFVAERVFSTPDDGGERSVYADQMMERLQEGLDRLSPEHRAILLMREIEGLSYEDIAGKMKCGIGTVMSRLFYARQNIRKFLERKNR
ncbi:MAG TPA: RNA polymerase sigma factor [bacterium]|nr:RNA polymerase sigma factor [bacterium]